MVKIAAALPECEHWFSPHYADGLLGRLQPLGFLDFTTPGRRWVRRMFGFLRERDLNIDYKGKAGPYDLVVLPTDLIVPRIARRTPTVLVQEGMTDPETALFELVRLFPILPRWLASSAAYGLSGAYDVFCVASEGYRDLFVRKGVRPEKIRVTGIPNFDGHYKVSDKHAGQLHTVLACTSDARENFRFEDRRAFIERAVRIANGRTLVFKLHPNENTQRASREIRRYAPSARIVLTGSAEEFIPHCDVLITKWSSVAYLGLAMGKEVYSDFPADELLKLMPLQHGRAAEEIAAVCREVLQEQLERTLRPRALEGVL